MPVSKNAFAAALALSISTFAIAGASEMKPEETARQGFVVPSVISVAYRDPRIAMNAAEAFRQGGFKVAGATRWLGAPEPVGTGRRVHCAGRDLGLLPRSPDLDERDRGSSSGWVRRPWSGAVARSRSGHHRGQGGYDQARCALRRVPRSAIRNPIRENAIGRGRASLSPAPL